MKSAFQYSKSKMYSIMIGKMLKIKIQYIDNNAAKLTNKKKLNLTKTLNITDLVLENLLFESSLLQLLIF